MALTRRQREVLDVVRGLIEENGYSPSLEEIGAELGLSSVATVHKHVSHLVQKGYVRRAWNQNRSIELVESRERVGAIQLPVEGRFTPGSPLEAPAIAEEVAVPVTMVREESAAFALRAGGDGLREERIRGGDILLLERGVEVRDGETVLVLSQEGAAGLRRFEETLRQAAEAGEVQVAGLLLGVIRTY
jgi:repressor LexA